MQTDGDRQPAVVDGGTSSRLKSGRENACYRARVQVNSAHPDYDANAAAWLRASDVFAGEDAVKSAGKLYLPKLDSPSFDEYNAYRSRASFFNATARIADGFVGLIFRREPTFKVPDDNAGVGNPASSNRSSSSTAFRKAARPMSPTSTFVCSGIPVSCWPKGHGQNRRRRFASG